MVTPAVSQGNFNYASDDIGFIQFSTSTSGTGTFYIDDVLVYGPSYSSPGYYDSSTSTLPGYISAVKPFWNVTTPSSTQAWINLSRDGGSTWNPSLLTNGQWYHFPTEAIGNELCYNVTMDTAAVGFTPILHNITIYYTYCIAPDVKYIGEASGNKFGYSVHGAGDINGDNNDDIIIGAPYNSNGSAAGGAVYIFNGSATLSGTIYAWNANYTNYSYDTGSHFGWSVCKAGDLDDDGNADVAIGAPAYSSSTGKTWIMCIVIIPEFNLGIVAIFMPIAVSFTVFTRKRRKGGRKHAA